MPPLDEITVLDLTRLLPGAVATMMLGDFGADIIKVELPSVGDPARQLPAGGQTPGAYFLAANRNKRSLALDLKKPAGREIFLRLVRRADVVVESFRPGVMERLGLGYERLQEANSGIICCAITGYGQDGPYCHKAGHDINYLSNAGVLGLIGSSDGPPVIPGVQIADVAGGALPAVIGILLALAARQHTGKGQLVDIAMMDGALATMFLPLADYLTRGTQQWRDAQIVSGRYACYHVYETRDRRYLALGALEPKFWANACRLLRREDLIPLQFAEDPARTETIAVLEAIFRAKPASGWLAEFRDQDACLTLVLEVAEVLDDPQVRHRGLIVEPAAGEWQIAPTVRLAATPATIRLRPPRLGEHTRGVLAECGYSNAQIDQLLSDGIVGA